MNQHFLVHTGDIDSAVHFHGNLGCDDLVVAVVVIEMRMGKGAGRACRYFITLTRLRSRFPAIYRRRLCQDIV